jgi:hypothetical protein
MFITIDDNLIINTTHILHVELQDITIHIEYTNSHCTDIVTASLEEAADIFNTLKEKLNEDSNS